MTVKNQGMEWWLEKDSSIKLVPDTPEERNIDPNAYNQRLENDWERERERFYFKYLM